MSLRWIFEKYQRECVVNCSLNKKWFVKSWNINNGGHEQPFVRCSQNGESLVFRQAAMLAWIFVQTTAASVTQTKRWETEEGENDSQRMYTEHCLPEENCGTVDRTDG